MISASSRQLCDRVAVMYAGKIVEDGPTGDDPRAPAHPYTRRLIACVPELGGGKRALDAIPGLPAGGLGPAARLRLRRRAATRRPTPAGRRYRVRRYAPRRAVRCLHPERGSRRLPA